MKKVTIIVRLLICILVLTTMAQAAGNLRERLVSMEGTQALSVAAKEIAESPPGLRRAKLNELVQIVQENADSGKPSYGLVGQVAYILIAAADEQSIFDAFANNLQRLKRPDQIHAVEALSASASERAANVIASLIRERLARIPDSLPANPSEDQGRALNNDLVDFVYFMPRLAKCGEAGQNLANAIRSELVLKAEKAPLFKQILPMLDGVVVKETTRQKTSASSAISTPTPKPVSKSPSNIYPRSIGASEITP